MWVVGFFFLIFDGGGFVWVFFLLQDLIPNAYFSQSKFKNMAAHTSKSLRKDNPRIRVIAQLTPFFFPEQFRANSKKLKFSETVNKL